MRYIYIYIYIYIYRERGVEKSVNMQRYTASFVEALHFSAAKAVFAAIMIQRATVPMNNCVPITDTRPPLEPTLAQLEVWYVMNDFKALLYQ